MKSKVNRVLMGGCVLVLAASVPFFWLDNDLAAAIVLTGIALTGVAVGAVALKFL